MNSRRHTVPLSGPQRFAAVFADGKRVRKGGVTVVAAWRGSDEVRVGLVAGKGVGGAVVRNRTKRRIRAVLQNAELGDGFDYVVIASGAVATEPFESVASWVHEAVAQATADARRKPTRTRRGE